MDNKNLQSFADNPALMEAVKELLLSKFSTDKLKETEDDIKLGQMVRARLVGIQMVEDAFREIAQHRSIPKGVDKNNPAI